ncbi:MAG: hypothetical protein C4333_03090 [Meiothermus sp.]
MAGNLKFVLEKIQAAEVAWSQLAPERRLADMTLEEFRALIAPFRHRDSALEVAHARFARGEITLEEFEAIKQGLQG